MILGFLYCCKFGLQLIVNFNCLRILIDVFFLFSRICELYRPPSCDINVIFACIHLSCSFCITQISKVIYLQTGTMRDLIITIMTLKNSNCYRPCKKFRDFNGLRMCIVEFYIFSLQY